MRISMVVTRSLAVGVMVAGASGLAHALPQTFDDPTPVASEQFGHAVSLSGDNVLIGANLDVTADGRVGQAHLFSAATGALLQTFDDPTPTFDDRFGSSVSVSGDNVLIGAARDDTTGVDVGQAHLFNAASGALLRTFDDPTPTGGDSFGSSVSVSGDNVLIGAAFDDTTGVNVGQAHLFSVATGALLQTFDDPTPTGGDSFGGSVSVSGDNVLIGAAFDDTTGVDVGQAHLFSAATGALLQTFDDPTPSGGDLFGNSVSVSGDNVLIGAVLDDTSGVNVGRAFLFSAATGALLQTFDDPTPTGGLVREFGGGVGG